MERTYRIALIIEGTFERKVKAKAEAQRLMRGLKIKAPWSKTATKVTSKAKPAPKPARPPSEDAKLRAEILAQTHRVADELRVCDPTLPRISIRWLNDGGCGYTRGNASAHAHPGKWYASRSRSKKRSVPSAWSGQLTKRVRLPRNLICLIAPWNIRRVDATTGADTPFWTGPQVKKVREPYDDERMADLLAHEIMHMRFTSKTHRAKAFHQAARSLIAKWKAWKDGTFAPPVRVPAFARKTSADLTMPQEGETREAESSATTDGDENLD